MRIPRSTDLLYVVLACVVTTAALLGLGRGAATGPYVIGGLGALALLAMGQRVLRSYAFTIWVFAFVAASMYYPAAFGTWFGMDLGRLIVPLIQIIMFGMGTTLSLADFTRVLKTPWPVFVGMLLQFSVMPLVGAAIARGMGFEPEIAAGVILIGSVSGGVASNLMTYLARGDVALSVTMTACSTLLSPLTTPFWMKTLAGRLVPIDFVSMMFSILDMTVVPVAAGIVANRILYSKAAWARRPMLLVAGSLGGFGIFATGILLEASLLGPFGALRNGFAIGAFLLGAVCLARLVVSVWLDGPENWMDRALPVVAMVGICTIIAIITARSREDLLSIGPALVLAAMLHNSIGYVGGYWLSRAVGLDERTCRTVSIEVGMQNGGMATGLAMGVLKSAKVALAPAIFGPWMNVSGSVLATWWHRRPVAPPAARASS